MRHMDCGVPPGSILPPNSEEKAIQAQHYDVWRASLGCGIGSPNCDGPFETLVSPLTNKPLNEPIQHPITKTMNVWDIFDLGNEGNNFDDVETYHNRSTFVTTLFQGWITTLPGACSNDRLACGTTHSRIYRSLQEN